LFAKLEIPRTILNIDLAWNSITFDLKTEYKNVTMLIQIVKIYYKISHPYFSYSLNREIDFL